MLSKIKTFSKKIAVRLARTDILFWTLPLLMFLLVIGTIAQKYIGLYASLNLYFASFITFIGPIPFPGGFTLMTILFVNMLMKFLMFSEWSWQKSGTIMVHLGVLVLIVGGGITAFTQKEGFLIVKQGEMSNIIEDYHQRLFRITKDGQNIFSIPHEAIAEGQRISIPTTNASVTIDQFCLHCRVELRGENEIKGWHAPGSSMKLVDDRPLTEHEQNMTGVEFTITGIDHKQDGKYLTFDKFPKPPSITIDGATYKFEIIREIRELPFHIHLTSFEQKLHAGTNMAKAYQSDVKVIDDKDSWEARIEMNEPLRYKGYTLYQSSFDISGDVPYTILNVVQNKGQFFPYIATIIMTVGLVLHMILRARRKRDEWTS
jgi:hypothetical protein